MSTVMTLSPSYIDKRDRFAFYHGDNVEITRGLPDDSVDLTVSSPPFAMMYAYSNSPRDIGNCESADELLEHFGFLVEQLLRVTKPGRSCCIHLTNGTLQKGRDGVVGRVDFRGDVIRLFQKWGWIYASEVAIDKDPQMRAVRTKDRGLLFKSLATDASVMAPVMLDYMLIFRKPGENAKPIKAGRSEKYKNPQGWVTEAQWIEFAHGVWYRRVKEDASGLDDCGTCEAQVEAHMSDSLKATSGHPSRFLESDGIDATDVLNNFREARCDEDERHLCPLQLDVIERCVMLFSNPDDVVFDPFGGIGSTPYVAIRNKRKGIGVELKESYFKQAVRNCDAASRAASMKQSTIFDVIGED